MEWTPEQNGHTLKLTNQLRLVSTSKMHEALFQYSSDDSFVPIQFREILDLTYHVTQ